VYEASSAVDPSVPAGSRVVIKSIIINDNSMLGFMSSSSSSSSSDASALARRVKRHTEYVASSADDPSGPGSR